MINVLIFSMLKYKLIVRFLMSTKLENSENTKH